ncbi:histone H4 transcription factor-like isoform X2 [Cryptotermes secundus]|uniref:histone H4 transcription factor-like isoform X2 n=1 Tax=Cryptotermes secundus TaxID=105785 RepID=UPI001454DE3C|nr:histone H4 transcription factor-like isoform X2 [Cryptotermes secundus]
MRNISLLIAIIIIYIYICFELLKTDNLCVAGVYVCLWEKCGFESADSSEITRHVNFHSYHTKLKCIGSNILARSGLPICTLQVAGEKVVPDLPHAFECCWQTCEETFSSPQLYFNHVDVHVYCNPRGRKVEGGIPCQWCGCMSKSTYRTVYKLLDHIRIHIKEKLVGCPQCGGLFASRARFGYHCKHQVPVELRGPSVEMAKNQMNRQRHKCPFCGQSFSCPSSLCLHIRYRHPDSKPFRCSFCEYKQYSATADVHSSQFTVIHAQGFSFFTSRLLVTELKLSHCD